MFLREEWFMRFLVHFYHCASFADYCRRICLLLPLRTTFRIVEIPEKNPVINRYCRISETRSRPVLGLWKEARYFRVHIPSRKKCTRPVRLLQNVHACVSNVHACTFYLTESRSSSTCVGPIWEDLVIERHAGWGYRPRRNWKSWSFGRNWTVQSHSEAPPHSVVLHRESCNFSFVLHPK